MLTRALYNQTMKVLGIPMTFHKIKPPQSIINIPAGGIATPRKDIEGINNYGVGSKVITLLQSDLGSVMPEKFDYVIITGSGEKLVFEAVVSAHESGSGSTIGYRCYVRGK